MYTHFLHCIHPPTPFTRHLSTPPGASPPPTLGRTCSALLFTNFVEEEREKIKWKIWHFSLFEIKVATQEVSVWYFHLYMYIV
jgi:hypothetical protein